MNPTSASNGTVLWSSQTVIAIVNPSISCRNNIDTVTYSSAGTYNSAYQAFSTNIPGIGLRVSLQSPGPGSTLPYSMAVNTNQLNTSMNFSVSLIKTGPITQGGTISGPIVQVTASNVPGVLYYVGLAGGGIVINPTIPTCSVTTPSIVVPLGNVAQSTFKGVGTTSSAQPFNIGLNCSGGATGVSATVYTTLTDQTNPSNQSSTLSLSSSSTATGVGIQVLNGGTPISYGPDLRVIGNTNQWQAGLAGNSSFTIPLSARYVQTATSIKGGTANGVATFTMGYQ